MPNNVQKVRNLDNVRNIAATDCLNQNGTIYFLRSGLNEYAVKKAI